MMTHMYALTADACIRCGNDRIMFIDERITFRNEKVERKAWSCWCHCCGEMSPARLTQAHAVESWNAMQEVESVRRATLARFKKEVS